MRETLKPKFIKIKNTRIQLTEIESYRIEGTTDKSQYNIHLFLKTKEKITFLWKLEELKEFNLCRKILDEQFDVVHTDAKPTCYY